MQRGRHVPHHVIAHEHREHENNQIKDDGIDVHGVSSSLTAIS